MTAQGGLLLHEASGARPLVEEGERFFLAVLAALEADLQQVIQRLPDDRARPQAEVSHHLVSVDGRAYALQVLLGGEARDAFFERVHRDRELARAHLVARRGVTANQP